MDRMVQCGLSDWVIRYWALRGAPTDHFKRKTAAERFEEIYAHRIWGREQESLSGFGSSIHATVNIRQKIPDLLKILNINVLLDLGCGDFNWMKECALPCRYIGVDVVQDVINSNIRKYATTGRTFLALDAIRESLPQSDAVLCREVLFHLSFSDARLVMENVIRSGAKYFIATTDPSVLFNADIPTGGGREINLSRRPYRLGMPIHTLADGDGENTRRILGVWLVDAPPTTIPNVIIGSPHEFST